MKTIPKPLMTPLAVCPLTKPLFSLAFSLLISLLIGAQAGATTASTTASSTVSSADAAPTAAAVENCTNEISKAVLAAVKLVGIKDEIGFEIHPTGKTSKTILGETLQEYVTSIFIVPEGYITGSGAEAFVKPTANGCEVVKLSVSAR
jgi:hypothetical protein